MSEWLFADSDMPNWFMCMVAVFSCFALWTVHDSILRLRKSTEKWNDVALLYKRWADAIDEIEARK